MAVTAAEVSELSQVMAMKERLRLMREEESCGLREKPCK